MKKIKYVILLVAFAASFSSCVVRVHSGPWVPGHYVYGPNGGRHWIRGHYAG